MKILNILLILILISNISCRKKEIDNPIDDWFQDPPVEPITQVIKTVVPVGYAATIVTMDMKGLKSPSVKVEKQKSAKVLYVDTNSDDYPFKFKNDTYGQLLVAYVQTDENSALVSVFFTDLDVTTGNFKLENIIAFPIIYDELEDKTTAVYASIDVNINSISGYGLDLSETEVEENLDKLNNERVYNTTNTDIAIAQNAWIIDIYHNGTFDDAYDDQFKIFGGQQAVKVQDFDTESSTGALQMAMIDVDFSADCSKNPTNGYAFIQDVEVATSTNDNDIVFGHVFYEFTPDCDGRVLVDIATGNFIFAIGKELNLGLN
jgi:hypothetical protein